MAFQLIDMENWERAEYYQHYLHKVRCSYSTTVPIDITRLKGRRLYPAMIWLLTQTVNQMPEFRTALTDEGLGIWDEMHPAYTIFNKENKSFSGIWTKYSGDYLQFLQSYEEDAAAFASSAKLFPKPGRPANTFDISMTPWIPFSSFHLHVFNEGTHLLPIFTMGKFCDENGKRTLPLAIQVHHAVCDGYHVGAFIETLQEKIDAF